MTSPEPPVTLVIVDDEAAIAEFVCRVARRVLPAEAGHRVVAAASPEDALRILTAEATSPNRLAVFADHNLGTPMNGIALLSEIARRFPRARRYLMSGYSLRDLAPDPAIAPLDGFVGKPMDLLEIRRLLQALLAPLGGRSESL